MPAIALCYTSMNMKVPGFRVTESKLGDWLARRDAGRAEAEAAGERFTPTCNNPLTLPSNFPGLRKVAKDVKLERISSQRSGNALADGLRISGAALTGIAGAVLTLALHEGSPQAHLEISGHRIELPTEPVAPGAPQVDIQLNDRKVTVYPACDGRTDVSAELAGGPGLKATFREDRTLNQLSAYTENYGNLVGMQFTPGGRAKSVTVSHNDLDSPLRAQFGTNATGFYAYSTGSANGIPLQEPTGQHMLRVATTVMELLPKIV